jgi:hypothetical protein
MKIVKKIGLLVVLSFSTMTNASIIANGDFEDGSFTNDSANYDLLSQGDGSLSAWEIIDDVVWGMNPNDGFAASSGNGFIDLSGFSNNSPNGQINQSLTTSIGLEYLFSIDRQGDNAQVSINGEVLDLAVAAVSGQWTTYTGFYTATSNSSLLSLKNLGNNPIVFVDNLSMVEIDAPINVSGPAMFSLISLSFFGIFCRKRMFD